MGRPTALPGRRFDPVLAAGGAAAFHSRGLVSIYSAVGEPVGVGTGPGEAPANPDPGDEISHESARQGGDRR